MIFLSGGHGATDISQGAVAALLVFWRPELDLSYTEVTAIVLVATLSSSLVQPLFGLWSDHRGMAWLLPIGVATSGIGMAAASIAPSYSLLLLFVFISGLGVAAYHPEASKFARYVSGRRRSSGMSLFSIGGNLGFAIGPLFASTLVIALGLRGGLLLAVVPVLFAVVLASVVPYLKRFAPDPATQRSPGARRGPASRAPRPACDRLATERRSHGSVRFHPALGGLAGETAPPMAIKFSPSFSSPE